jgi:hypothetical protein
MAGKKDVASQNLEEENTAVLLGLSATKDGLFFFKCGEHHHITILAILDPTKSHQIPFA